MVSINPLNWFLFSKPAVSSQVRDDAVKKLKLTGEFQKADDLKEAIDRGDFGKDFSIGRTLTTALTAGALYSGFNYVTQNSGNISIGGFADHLMNDAGSLLNTFQNVASDAVNSGPAQWISQNIGDPLIKTMGGGDLAQIAFYSITGLGALWGVSSWGLKGAIVGTAMAGALLSTWNNTDFELDRSSNGVVNDIARYMDEHFGQDGIVDLGFNGGGRFGPKHVVPR